MSAPKKISPDNAADIVARCVIRLRDAGYEELAYEVGIIAAAHFARLKAKPDA